MNSPNPPTGVILGAGAAIRLRPLSLTKPKALFPTLDRPQLDWRVAALERAGIEQICVNIHHHAPQMSSYLQSLRARSHVSLEEFIETEPLGTGGALRNMKSSLSHTILLSNADVATSAPLADLLSLHAESNAAATVLAIPHAQTSDMSITAGRVERFLDRNERQVAGHVYGCAAVLDKASLDYIPEGPSGLYETVFTGLVQDGATVSVLEWDGYWSDVGTPEAHIRVNLDAVRGLIGPPPETHGEPERFDDSYIGNGAEWDGAQITDSVVGHKAVVDSGAVLNRCVVWDHTWVPAGTYSNTVLTPAGNVAVSDPSD